MTDISHDKTILIELEKMPQLSQTDREKIQTYYNKYCSDCRSKSRWIEAIKPEKLTEIRKILADGPKSIPEIFVSLYPEYPRDHTYDETTSLMNKLRSTINRYDSMNLIECHKDESSRCRSYKYSLVRTIEKPTPEATARIYVLNRFGSMFGISNKTRQINGNYTFDLNCTIIIDTERVVCRNIGIIIINNEGSARHIFHEVMR